MTDLFIAIDTYLQQHAERSRRRDVLDTALARGRWERNLWRAIAPFVHSADDYRAAAIFMAHMTREHARD